MLNKQGTVEYKGHQTWEKNVRTSLSCFKTEDVLSKACKCKTSLLCFLIMWKTTLLLIHHESLIISRKKGSVPW